MGYGNFFGIWKFDSALVPNIKNERSLTYLWNDSSVLNVSMSKSTALRACAFHRISMFKWCRKFIAMRLSVKQMDRTNNKGKYFGQKFHSFPFLKQKFTNLFSAFPLRHGCKFSWHLANGGKRRQHQFLHDIGKYFKCFSRCSIVKVKVDKWKKELGTNSSKTGKVSINHAKMDSLSLFISTWISFLFFIKLDLPSLGRGITIGRRFSLKYLPWQSMLWSAKVYLIPIKIRAPLIYAHLACPKIKGSKFAQYECAKIKGRIKNATNEWKKAN